MWDWLRMAFILGIAVYAWAVLLFGAPLPGERFLAFAAFIGWAGSMAAHARIELRDEWRRP